MTDGGNIGGLHGNSEPRPTAALPIDVEQVDNYYTYESSPLEVPFSSCFITEMTIGRCVAEDLQVLPVLPEGALKFLGWSWAVPQECQFLLMGTSIPGLKDIQSFIGEMNEAYIKGYRSVVIEFKGM
jgi:hypothetical protein